LTALTIKESHAMFTMKEMHDQLAADRLEHREYLKIHQPREDLNMTEGVKALLTIHGGGIIAMLGFMQALITKDAFTQFKWNGQQALLFFALGLIAAALTPALRFIYVRALINDWKLEKIWDYAALLMWNLSLAFFVCAIFYVGTGLNNLDVSKPQASTSNLDGSRRTGHAARP
jgi:hypothetical protein